MSKCYFAHGGNELVIGGKLTFLPGASVEGGEGPRDCSIFLREVKLSLCPFWLTARRPP